MSKDFATEVLCYHALLDSPIAFHRVFVSITDSVTAALLLSQCLYWSKRTRDPEGWFFKSCKEWTEETGLSRTEQENARKTLKKLKLVEEKFVGIPARLYFKVCPSRLDEHLSLLVLSGCRKPASLVSVNMHHGLRGSRNQGCGKTSSYYKDTETTAEITEEITERGGKNGDTPSQINNFSFPSYSRGKSAGESQKDRYKAWIHSHWAELFDKYSPFFMGSESHLRWSLINCVNWAYDNPEKSSRYSDPGTRIRKWLDEEDVERVFRSMEGQGRAAERVTAGNFSHTQGPTGEENPSLDPSDPEGMVEHFRKVFSLFSEFIRKNSFRELGEDDWANLDQAIRKDPAVFMVGSDFGALYEFFDIKLD